MKFNREYVQGLKELHKFVFLISIITMTVGIVLFPKINGWIYIHVALCFFVIRLYLMGRLGRYEMKLLQAIADGENIEDMKGYVFVDGSLMAYTRIMER